MSLFHAASIGAANSMTITPPPQPQIIHQSFSIKIYCTSILVVEVLVFTIMMLSQDAGLWSLVWKSIREDIINPFPNTKEAPYP